MILVSTFSDFVGAVTHYIENDAPYSWRAGQAAFNLLGRVRPDLVGLISGSDFDPFYTDANLPAFYDFVMRHWNDGEI